MTPSPIERQLRLFCRALAVLMSGGAATELWLVEHTESLLQLLPFGLCVLLAGSVTLVSLRNSRGLVGSHRVLMVLVVLGGLYGVYTHVSGNMQFAREIRPSASPREIWIAGFRGGNPPLAPGVLIIAATLGLAGTHGLTRSTPRR